MRLVDFDLYRAARALQLLGQGDDGVDGGKPGNGEHVLAALLAERAKLDHGQVVIGAEAFGVAVEQLAAQAGGPQFDGIGHVAQVNGDFFQPSLARRFFVRHFAHRLRHMRRARVRLTFLLREAQAAYQRGIDARDLWLAQGDGVIAARGHDAQDVFHLGEIGALLVVICAAVAAIGGSIIAIGGVIAGCLFQVERAFLRLGRPFAPVDALDFFGLFQRFFGFKKRGEYFIGAVVEGDAFDTLAVALHVVGQQFERVAVVEDEHPRVVDRH